MPGQPSAWAVILRSRAGQVVYRRAKKVCLGGILPTNYDLIVIFLRNRSRSRVGTAVTFFAWENTTGLSAKPEPVPCRDRLWGPSVSHPEHGGLGRIPTGDRNGSGGSPLAGRLIHDQLGHHLMNGRRQPGEDAGCKIARMMIRSKNIGEVPMDGAVHTSSPHSYSVPKAGEKPWKNNPDTPPAYEEMEGKGKI